MPNDTPKESRKERRKKAWQEYLPYERAAQVTSMFLGSTAIVVLVLGLLGVWDVIQIAFDAFTIGKGLLALSDVCTAVALWRIQRAYAKRCILTAIGWVALAIVDVFF